MLLGQELCRREHSGIRSLSGWRRRSRVSDAQRPMARAAKLYCGTDKPGYPLDRPEASQVSRRLVYPSQGFAIPTRNRFQGHLNAAEKKHKDDHDAEEFTKPLVAFRVIALNDVLLPVIVQHLPLAVPIVAVTFLLFDLFLLKLLETRDMLLSGIRAGRLSGTLCRFPILI